MRKKLALTLLLFINCSIAVAQWATSNNWNPSLNGTYEYSYTRSSAFVKRPSWNISNGTLVNEWLSTDKLTAYCTITWTTPGINVPLTLVVGSTVVAQGYLNISCPPMFAPSVSITNSLGGGNSANQPASFTINASPGAGGASVRWYHNSSGGTHFFESNVYSTSTLYATTTLYISTFYLSYTTDGGLEKCESTRIPLTLNILPPNPPSFYIENNICSIGSSQITASPGSGGNTVRWYNVGGTLLFTGTLFNTPVLSSSTTYYLASYNNTTGLESTRVSVTPIIHPMPPTPTVSNTSRCGEGYVNLNASAAGHEIRWYDAQDNFIVNGNSHSPYISSTTSYKVRSYNTSTGCIGNAVTVVATINPAVGNPTLTPAVICSGRNISITGSPGSNANTIRWYSAPVSGILLTENTNYSTPSLTGNTTYYASSYNTSTGCEGNRLPVSVTVNPLPAPPNYEVMSPICGASGSTTIAATFGSGGNQVKWYTTNSSPHATYTGGDFGTPVISSTTSWYLTSANSTTGCESHPRTVATVQLSPLPATPSVSHVERCGEGNVVVAATPGSNEEIRWYSLANEYLATGNSYSTYLTNSTQFKARSVNVITQCASEYAIVNATIKLKPEAPTYLYSSTIYGKGQVTLDVEESCKNCEVRWYESETGGSILATGDKYQTPILVAPKNYYASFYHSLSGCESDRTLLVADVKPIINASNITTEAIRVAGVHTDLEIDNLQGSDKKVQITYLDGLQREIQQIQIGGTPLGNNIVMPVEYDALGRTTKKFLPYATPAHQTSFQATYAEVQSSFYNNGATDKIADDLRPFTTLVYESSPIGRLLEQQGVGEDWFTNEKKQIVSYGYNSGATTSEAEEVRRFNTDGSSTGFYLKNTLNRIESIDEQGNKTIVFSDSDGKTIVKKQQLEEVIDGVTVNYLQTYYIYDDYDRITFIITPKGSSIMRANGWSFTQNIKNNYSYQFVYDRRGRVVEKKVPGQAPKYFCYDKLNRLVLAQDGIIKGTNKWIFIKYDQQGNAVIQGLYQNNLQTTRAAVQEIIDGLYTNTNPIFTENTAYETRGTILHGYTNNSFPKTNADNLPLEVLVVNYYDGYDFDYNGVNDFSYTPQGLPNEGTAITYTNGVSTGSKRLILGTTTSWLYNYVFYDQQYRPIQTRSNSHLYLTSISDLVTNVYDFEGKVTSTRTFLKNAPAMEQQYEYLPTGQLTKIFGSSPIHESINWTNPTKVQTLDGSVQKTGTQNTWDAGVFSGNGLGINENGHLQFRAGESNTYKMIGLSDSDVNVNYNTIDYAIYPAANGTIFIYENGNSIGSYGAYTVNDYFSIERKNGVIYYRKNNKILHTSTTVHNGVLYIDCSLMTTNASFKDIKIFKEQKIILAQYEYNELGQLVDKKLHSTDNASSFLQSIDYRYTIQGQLASINNSQLTIDNKNDDSNDYFGMEFLYNTIQSGLNNAALYNGNISAIKWKGIASTIKPGEVQSYRYSYDKSNRLKSATSQVFSGAAWNKEVGVFNESVTYDQNGNIKTLQRYDRALQSNAYTQQIIDDLTYTYDSNIGDRLLKVEDAALLDKGFLNGSNTNVEYSYNTNGDITADQNKKINGISYNILGKPSTITFTDTRKIVYTYDAAGNKLKMVTYKAGNVVDVTTDYVGNFVYENSNLAFFGSPEGRVVMNGTQPEYQYTISDHQGNTRVLFTSAPVQAQPDNTSFEEEVNTSFNNYPSGANRSSWDLFSRTGTYSQLLNAGYNAQVGVAKSFAVYPGDKVKIEAYAKYYTAHSGSVNLTGFATALIGAFGLSTPQVGEVGTASSALNDYGSIIATGGGQGSNNFPKIFVNIILFDKNYNLVDLAFEQIDGGEQIGATPKAAHDYLMSELSVKEAGYAFIYISNENPTYVEAYFDDVSITHTPTNILQYNEYYPFGLQTSNSWTRENNSNNFLYNAATEQNPVSGYYDLFYRSYDPALGRFMQVDPLALLDHSVTSYAYASNNPVSYNDPLGDRASVNGYTDGQLHTLYRLQRANYSDYVDWARDNIDGSSGGRSFRGTDGKDYIFNASGEIGRLAWFEYRYFYSDGVEAEYRRENRLEWVAEKQIQGGSLVLDINGNIIRYDQDASLIYIDTGNGIVLFRNQLVKDGTMTPKAFSNALLSVVNGMNLPVGTFDKNRLHNGEISLAITGLDGKVISYNDGRQGGAQAHYMDGKNGTFLITYQHFSGSSLTVQVIQSLLGIHEYYAHGVVGLRHWRLGDDEKIDKLVSGYPYN